MNFRTETRNGLPAMVFDLPKDRRPVGPTNVAITCEPETREEKTQRKAFMRFLDEYVESEPKLSGEAFPDAR